MSSKEEQKIIDFCEDLQEKEREKKEYENSFRGIQAKALINKEAIINGEPADNILTNDEDLIKNCDLGSFREMNKVEEAINSFFSDLELRKSYEDDYKTLRSEGKVPEKSFYIAFRLLNKLINNLGEKLCQKEN